MVALAVPVEVKSCGDRAIKHYMQRTALQSSPTILTALTQEYHAGGRRLAMPLTPSKILRRFTDW